MELAGWPSRGDDLEVGPEAQLSALRGPTGRTGWGQAVWWESPPPPPFRLQSPGSNTWLYPVAQEARWVQGNIDCTHSSKFHASGRLHQGK